MAAPRQTPAGPSRCLQARRWSFSVACCPVKVMASTSASSLPKGVRGSSRKAAWRFTPEDFLISMPKGGPSTMPAQRSKTRVASGTKRKRSSKSARTPTPPTSKPYGLISTAELERLTGTQARHMQRLFYSLVLQGYLHHSLWGAARGYIFTGSFSKLSRRKSGNRSRTNLSSFA